MRVRSALVAMGFADPGVPRGRGPVEMARASIALRDADMGSPEQTMWAAHLARSMGDSPSVLADIDTFQRSPERGFLGKDAVTGAFLWPEFLEERYAVGQDYTLTFSVLGLSAPSEPTGVDEPDTLDVLRTSLRNLDTSLENALVEFAIWRAFAHNRYGDFGRVRFDWAIAMPDAPRSLGPLRPLRATGASYLWIDTRSAPANGSLDILLRWEEGALIRLAVLTFSHEGEHLDTSLPAGLFGATEARNTLSNLTGVASVLVAVVHVGAGTPSVPVDPDSGPRERNYAISLYPNLKGQP